MWLTGAALIVANWLEMVSFQVAQVGFLLAMVGAVITWLPSRPAGFVPGQEPVPPSGIEVRHDTPLDVGSRVLAFSQGYWLRARVVAIEDSDMVR
jgi:hypothetical protein